MDWSGSSIRVPALHIQSPEFKPKSHQKEEEEEEEENVVHNKVLSSFKEELNYFVWR
jgi:hypothetical protein